MDGLAPAVRGTLPHERRRRLMRWVILVIVLAVLFMPVAQVGMCTDSASGAGTCDVRPASLVGMVLGITY